MYSLRHYNRSHDLLEVSAYMKLNLFNIKTNVSGLKHISPINGKYIKPLYAPISLHPIIDAPFELITNQTILLLCSLEDVLSMIS